MNSRKKTDYEAWASLLLNRKVPPGCGHLIKPDVVKRGAAILKAGAAFEVHVKILSEKAPLVLAIQAGQVTVTKMPRPHIN